MREGWPDRLKAWDEPGQFFPIHSTELGVAAVLVRVDMEYPLLAVKNLLHCATDRRASDPSPGTWIVDVAVVVELVIVGQQHGRVVRARVSHLREQKADALCCERVRAEKVGANPFVEFARHANENSHRRPFKCAATICAGRRLGLIFHENACQFLSRIRTPFAFQLRETTA